MGIMVYSLVWVMQDLYQLWNPVVPFKYYKTLQCPVRLLPAWLLRA